MSTSMLLKDGQLLCVRPPRREHNREFTLYYQGRLTEGSEAELELLRIMLPDRCARDSRQRLFLKYAMHQTQIAITLHDEVIAARCEDEDEDELVLSYHVGLAKVPLAQEYKDWIGKHLREILKDTCMEDLTDADGLGLSGFTLESLQELRCRLQRLSQEEMGLLIDVTWFWCTPRLAWGLDFSWVGATCNDEEE